MSGVEKFIPALQQYSKANAMFGSEVPANSRFETLYQPENGKTGSFIYRITPVYVGLLSKQKIIGL